MLRREAGGDHRGHPGPPHTPPSPQDRDRDPSRAGHWTPGRRCTAVLVVQWDLLCTLARMHPLPGLGPATLQGPKLGKGKHTVPQWVIGGPGKWNHLCSTTCFLAPWTLAGDTVPQ